ncbi:MAG: hypothetical protein JNK60_00675, partial [Acidobacteria bacterium]|nr:hypothetical protein [Acidobacteriota bacterium]
MDVDRIRGPPGLQLENRTWTLQILGQSVVVVAQGVSTRLVWSCGGPGFDAVRYDCARSEYEGSASFRKLQSLWHVLEYDEQTRPCYAKNRWYDPETGSFVSADPLGFPDSMNQYAWGVGNYWKADPLGLCMGLDDIPCMEYAREWAMQDPRDQGRRALRSLKHQGIGA